MTLQAIQALGGLQTPRRALWLDLLNKLADQPDLAFINEFIALISIASQSKIRDEEDVLLGSIARRLLKWMWARAQGLTTHQSEQLRDVAGGRVLPIVIQYYATDPPASREIVESVLHRFGTSDSSSNDAFVLTREMRHIVDQEPSLAVVVYERMFSHPVQSEEKTFYGSAVLKFSSTQKQDFESALYGLQQPFPNFLETAPAEAARAAVLAVNVETRREDSLVSTQRSRERFTFRFLGRPAVYESDFSEIWDRGGSEHLSLQLLNAVLQRLPTSSQPQIRLIIRAIGNSAAVAVCWKRLVEAASANVRVLYQHVRGLLKIPRFLAAPEVTIAVGNLLKAAYAESVVSESDKVQIERAIKSIARARFVRRYEKPESIQNRLLLCIGAERILSAGLRNRAEELVSKEQAVANEPYVRITGGAIAYSTEDWLRDEGADVTKPENAQILAQIKEITAFEHRFLNSVPSTEECLGIEVQLRGLQQLTDTTADERISEHARGVLYAAVKSVLKNQELSRELPLVEFCRAEVLRGIADPVPAFDPKHHQSFDMPSWGGPLPRIEAAQGLYHLLWNYGPDEHLNSAFEQLSRDPVPAVRFQIATGVVGFFKHQDYDRFWQLVGHMMGSEPTVGVIVGLVESLGRVAGVDPQRAVGELTKLIDRGLPESGRSELARALMQILTSLYVVRGETRAGEQLARFEAEPVRYARAVASEVFTASYYLVPQNAAPDERERARELFRRVLYTSFKHLELVVTIEEPKRKADALSALMGHIDEVVTRMYFSLDINPDLRRPDNTLAADQQRDLYFELKPLITLVVHGDPKYHMHHLLPHTAHYLLELMNGVLQYDPAAVIVLAAQVAKAAAALDYHFDSLAIKEVVELVEQSLADHKELLKDPSVATALGEILDIFVRAGWPEALQLTFRLDQAVR